MSKMMYMDTQYAGVTPEKDFSDLIDFFYPVGCYFETSDENFNPNVSWSGTWVQETEGKVHISAGNTYISGEEYGSSTHSHTTGNFTLQDGHLPSHTHGSAGPSFTWNIFSDANGIISGQTSKNINQKYPGTGSGWGNHAGTFNTSHTHTAVGSGTAHNHGNTGDSSNIQPSIAVYRWHRIA